MFAKASIEWSSLMCVGENAREDECALNVDAIVSGLDRVYIRVHRVRIQKFAVQEVTRSD